MNENNCDPGECENDPKYTEPYVVPALPSDEEDGEGGGGGADLSNYYTKAEVNAQIQSAVAAVLSADEKAKLEAMPAITSIGDNLSLSKNGELNAAENVQQITEAVKVTSNTTSINGTVAANSSNAIAIGGSQDSMEGGAYASGANSIAIGGAATRGSLALGSRSSATAAGLAFHDLSMAIGTEAVASNGGMAIGDCTSATHAGSVALGFGAATTAENTLDIAYSDVNGGKPTPVPRRITHVGEGTEDTDAVNLGQVQSLVEGAGGGASIVTQTLSDMGYPQSYPTNGHYDFYFSSDIPDVGLFSFDTNGARSNVTVTVWCEDGSNWTLASGMSYSDGRHDIFYKKDTNMITFPISYFRIETAGQAPMINAYIIPFKQ